MPLGEFTISSFLLLPSTLSTMMTRAHLARALFGAAWTPFRLPDPALGFR
jgi:hypothetical protein